MPRSAIIEGVELGLSRVEHIQGEVKSLSLEELRAFRDWFASFDAEVWDAQIEADVKSEKLGSFAERAIRDHNSGRSSPL